MSPLRSPRAALAVVLAAVTGYAYVGARGAPGPIAWLASVGESDVDARGGVVLEARLDAAPAAAERAQIARVITARLEAQGAKVALTDVDARTMRIAAAGILPERASAIAAGLRMRGSLALRAVVDHGPDVDRIRDISALGVKIDQDYWTSPDGTSHKFPFASATDRAVLARAIAHIATDPTDEILIAAVPRDDDAGRAASFRTYLLARDVIIDNRDIEEATPGSDPYTEQPVVNLTFTRGGGDRFGDWTEAHTGDKLAIVIDGEVTSVPVINGAIRGGKAVITMGGLAPDHAQWDQARSLAAALASRDAMPVPLTVTVIDAQDPSIARAHLARFLAAIGAALLALAIAWGLRRWRALAPAAASAGTPAGEPDAGSLALGLGVTIAAPIALIVLGRIDAPGSATPMTAVGVTPIVIAFLVVELAALAMPSWRARRAGGRDERQPLLIATAALATALAIVQAWLVARFSVELGVGTSRWTIAAALCGGSLAYALGAAAIDRWGLGSGWAVVLAAPAIAWIAHAIHGADTATIALLCGEGALVALIVVGAARTRARGVRLPLGAFVAIALGAVIAGLVGDAMRTGPLSNVIAGDVLDFVGRANVQVIGAIAIGGGLASAWTRRLDAATRTAAITASIAIALAVLALELTSRTPRGDSLGVPMALLAAVIADVVVEARARALGAWRELARTGDVDRADAMLASSEGGTRFARALHVRALLRSFAPFAPIRIYEADDAER